MAFEQVKSITIFSEEPGKSILDPAIPVGDFARVTLVYATDAENIDESQDTTLIAEKMHANNLQADFRQSGLGFKTDYAPEIEHDRYYSLVSVPANKIGPLLTLITDEFDNDQANPTPAISFDLDVAPFLKQVEAIRITSVNPGAPLLDKEQPDGGTVDAVVVYAHGTKPETAELAHTALWKDVTSRGVDPALSAIVRGPAGATAPGIEKNRPSSLFVIKYAEIGAFLNAVTSTTVNPAPAPANRLGFDPNAFGPYISGASLGKPRNT